MEEVKQVRKIPFIALDKAILLTIGEGVSKRKDIYKKLENHINEVCKEINFKRKPVVLLDQRLFTLNKQKKIRHARRKNTDERYQTSYGWYINGVNYL